MTPSPRWLPQPRLTLVLVLVWLLLNNSLGPGHILLGLLLGWLIPLFSRRFWSETLQFHAPLTLLRFVGVVLWDILVANLTVARLILGQPRQLRSAFFEVPLDLKGEIGISLLANTISLTPGTVSLELSSDHSSLLVHALDAPDPDALVQEIKGRYEAPLKKVFEPCSPSS
ncbi:MAG: Na+/H+ antiporter subunit E [Chromatiaceae bacterium]